MSYSDLKEINYLRWWCTTRSIYNYSLHNG